MAGARLGGAGAWWRQPPAAVQEELGYLQAEAERAAADEDGLHGNLLRSQYGCSGWYAPSDGPSSNVRF